MFNHYLNNFLISDRKESNIFIQDILFIGESYINFLISKNKIYLPDHISSKDATVDLLAEIFYLENDVFVKFDNFFKNNFTGNLPLKESDFENYLRGFIYSIIQNNLTKIYKDSDPLTYNICRNIKESVKTLGLYFTNHFSDKYIHFEKTIELICEATEREDLILIIYKNKLNTLLHNIPAFLDALFKILKNQTNICQAVRFHDLVFSIKSILCNDFINTNGNSRINENISEEINLKFFLDDIRYSFSEKLEKYVLKNNLSQNFYECMYNIINDIIEEYKNGSGRKSILKLTKQYFNSDDKNLFYKVQYCVELFENEIIKNLKTEYYLIGR